jgi:hypothetical protein
MNILSFCIAPNGGHSILAARWRHMAKVTLPFAFSTLILFKCFIVSVHLSPTVQNLYRSIYAATQFDRVLPLGYFFVEN